MRLEIFDTLQYVKKLKAVGFTEAQAEVQAEAIAETFNEQLVTKNSLEYLLERLGHRLVIKLGMMMVVTIGVYSAIIKLL